MNRAAAIRPNTELTDMRQYALISNKCVGVNRFACTIVRRSRSNGSATLCIIHVACCTFQSPENLFAHEMRFFRPVFSLCRVENHLEHRVKYSRLLKRQGYRLSAFRRTFQLLAVHIRLCNNIAKIPKATVFHIFLEVKLISIKTTGNDHSTEIKHILHARKMQNT